MPNNQELCRGERRGEHFSSAISKDGIESKSFYWPIRLVFYQQMDDIIFGLVRKDEQINYNAPIFEKRSFVGLMPGDGRTIKNGVPKDLIMEPC